MRYSPWADRCFPPVLVCMKREGFLRLQSSSGVDSHFQLIASIKARWPCRIAQTKSLGVWIWLLALNFMVFFFPSCYYSNLQNSLTFFLNNCSVVQRLLNAVWMTIFVCCHPLKFRFWRFLLHLNSLYPC